MQISALSVEYIRVPVASTLNGAVINPTTDAVQMAFPLHGVAPITADWKTATWETDTVVTPNVYYARCLVGPGQTVLATGFYDVWVAITDNPEVPRRNAGTLNVV